MNEYMKYATAYRKSYDKVYLSYLRSRVPKLVLRAKHINNQIKVCSKKAQALQAYEEKSRSSFLSATGKEDAIIYARGACAAVFAELDANIIGINTLARENDLPAVDFWEEYGKLVEKDNTKYEEDTEHKC